ncbi:hypothetical protein ABBQ32_002198 [Trebouxia sp. C0010 RCD-2024]
MVLTLKTLPGSTCHTCFCGQAAYRKHRSPVQSRRPLQVCAEKDSRPPQSGEKKESPKFSFAPNSRSGAGYTDDDSAGQTNIFAVEPRLYLAGSDRDVEVNPAANIAIVTAGALAIAAIASGLVINFQSKPRAPIDDEAGEYLTLSQYKDKFSAPAAPALN